MIEDTQRNVCGAPSTGKPLRIFCPYAAVCCSACLATSPTEQFVRKDKTPVGQGLLSCRNCQTGSRLLEVTLSEVVAVFVQPGSKEDSSQAQLLGVTACSHMPKKLLQFVQGMPNHHTGSGWQLEVCTYLHVQHSGTHHEALRLAAVLLWLRKHGSAFWQAYIASLPQVWHRSSLLCQRVFAFYCYDRQHRNTPTLVLRDELAANGHMTPVSWPCW